MTLIEHLLELRNRVVACAIAVVLGVVLCAVFWENIMSWLLEPARAADPDFKLNVFSPTETIGIIFKIALYGGLIVATPVIVYEVLAFIVPGLTDREKKILLPAFFGAIFFLGAGMAFAYFVILPASLGFLLDLGDKNFEQEIGAKQYLDFATRIVFWVGVSFELPMVIAVVAKLGLVSWRQLLKFWRYAIVIIFILAAVITPTPDPLTQAFVAGPLMVLYALGIVFAAILNRGPRSTPAP